MAFSSNLCTSALQSWLAFQVDLVSNKKMCVTGREPAAKGMYKDLAKGSPGESQ